MSKRSAALLLVIVALLVAGWRFAPAGAPPLYDGICTAPQYRTIAQGATSASKMYPASPAGAFQTSEVVTGEDVPQVQVLMTDGTFVSPVPFTLTITPVQPPGPKPSDGTVDGNVYRIVATTQDGKQLQPVDSAHPVTILLRGTAFTPARKLERLDGSTWTPLKTFLVGCGDTFEGVTTKLGDFALVLPAGSTPGGDGGGGGVPIVPLVAGGTALVLVVLLGLIRIVRTRSR